MSKLIGLCVSLCAIMGFPLTSYGNTMLSTIAFFLMCFAIGCFIAHRTAEREGNIKAQFIWKTLAMLAVAAALVCYGIIAVTM